MSRVKDRKLTGMILAALLCTGGSLLNMSSVNAADVTVNEGETVDYVSNGAKGTGGWPAAESGVQTHNAIIKGTVNNAVYGGNSSDNNASGNTVTIGNVGGAQVTVSGTVQGGATQVAKEASNNVLTIQGDVNFTGDYTSVYGGFSMGGIANNNIVNILSKVTIPNSLEGGQSEGGTSSGNTLNISASGVIVGNGSMGAGLRAFQNLNFYLPTTITTSDTMLTVNGTADVTNAKVGVLAQGTLANLTKNSKVTLLSANTLTGGNTISQTTDISVPTSITTVSTYEFSVATESNKIVATLTNDGGSENNGGSGGDSGNSGGNSDSGNNGNNSSNSGIIDSETAKNNAKSVVETQAATTTFINAGSDMLASQGFAQAANAVALDTAKQQQNGGGAPAVSSFTPFAAFGGSSMRAESGSHVDTKGFGLNIGFAREIANGQGKLLFGPLVEYGGGKYDSYLDNGTHGDGKSHYWGIGLMARQINNDGLYYEGSLRVGRVNSDYNGNFNNQNVTYDSSSTYVATHLGLGKIMDLGHHNTLDSYLKYFYSHQGGDNVTMHASITGDENWSFSSINSHRLRLGARITHEIDDKNSFYGGLAYQFEFGGKATAYYNGGSTPSPSVRGGSGMMELGWQVKPGGPVTVDLGVTGWVGKQRGVSAQIGAVWSF
ncbi:outer membrane autotransporter barrel domain protein [Anaerovibrio sp. JC8]|uniref:autotransporter outer membrane beta-barrel domain-containing protein n=1 Tax=Anaerovibrio sp. JC8 TaxID=1240085 RepID=UPI000A09A319|nr:autotransporter outer membrane beta-barrel domain-containing protein [Anaerovibrio sp. JC8]ORU00141.1 outer membrane autotransporter barrel domain protein [Anaerovibrio sp. JC8]